MSVYQHIELSHVCYNETTLVSEHSNVCYNAITLVSYIWAYNNKHVLKCKIHFFLPFIRALN